MGFFGQKLHTKKKTWVKQDLDAIGLLFKVSTTSYGQLLLLFEDRHETMCIL